MKLKLLLLLSGFAALGFAQKPNPSYRLPETPDMPEWAKQLYREDIKVNLFELDEEFEAWEEAYEAEHEAEEELNKDKDAVEENLWEEYYTRWRASAYPYVQEDGFLDFSIRSFKEITWQPDMAAKVNTSPWSYMGPVVMRWTKNDNAAQPLCPWQANVYCIDVAPSDPNTLYYGSETGAVGKTTDKGLTWTSVGENFFTNNIGAIAIHPSNPDIVYASELANRIATTSDGGNSWSTALTISNFNCEDIKIKPDDPEVVLAAGTSLQRRTAGNVWTNVLNSKTYDIAFKPGDPSIVYVLIKNAALNLCEFWKSTDGGLTFSIRSSGWITALTDSGGRLTVTPADNNRIYAALLTGDGPRIMRSDDAGETWTIIASSNFTGLIGPCNTGALSMTNGQGYFDLSIVASQTNADQIIVGTTTSFKSTDGGVSYAPMGGYCGPFSTHPDFQEMVAKGSDTWIVTDGGINLSDDFYTDPTVGLHYFVRTNNLHGSEHWGFDCGWNEDVMVGGRYHDGNMAWRETYPAGDFLRMGGGEAATGYVNPGNNSMAYFSDLGGIGKILPLNNNQPVLNFTVTKSPNESFYPMEGAEQKWDPRYMYTYYLGNGNQFWKTTDNGLTFTALFTHSNATAEIRYVEVSRSNPDVIYFTAYVDSPTDGELWKSTDAGLNWTKCNNPGTLSASQRRFSKITLSGTDANTIWWCFRTGPNGQKVFKSSNGGSTWTNWTTAALDNLSATDVLHQLGTDGGVYFLTGNGGKVFYRDNVATDWTLYNTGLPLNIYGDFGGVFAKPYYKGGKLRLGTGNGIWEADLFTSSTTTLVQPMVDNPTPACSRDTIQLESYSVISGAATYQWAISPAPQWVSSLSVRNPRVSLGATPGSFSVTLTVTDANGVSTKTINNFLQNLPAGDVCATDTIPGKSLNLDGTGDYAVPNNNLNLNSNTVSMTAWVKRNGTQTDFAGIVYARGGTTSAGLSITSGNALRYTWDDAGGSYGFNTGFTIPDNVWTHIALVITPTNAKVYMNGVAATRTATHAAEAFDTPVKIGYDQGTRYFKGEIEEVTVWNKSLTQNEIRDLMHLTLSPQGQPNLVSYYQFNEASGLVQDKVSTRHASLAGNAARIVSTGPLGGGTSARLTVTSGGLKTFAAANVVLAFPASGTYPNGEIVVNRINLAPDSLPGCSAYHSDNHYWIIDNYGSNQTFSALDSARFNGFAVPDPAAIAATSYKLNRRSVYAHLLPWTIQAGSSTGATGGPAGHITFGAASGITQFGQFIATNTLADQIISPVSAVCAGSNVTLTAAAGYTAYSWSNGGGTGQMATYTNVLSTTTYTVTVTDANGCTGSAMKTVNVNPLPSITTPANSAVCIDVAAFSLTGALPAGGVYSGPGVSAGSFNPATAGAGTHVINYAYTDGNGCSNTGTFNITVNALPVLTCPANTTVNAGGGAFALTGGSPTGGTYSGPGVNAGMFDPAVAGIGMHTLTYNYTDANTCTNSCTFSITVTASNQSFSGKLTWEGDRLTTMTGVNNTTVTLSGDASDSNVTGLPGTYALSAVSGSNFVLTPTKNLPMPFAVNGLSAADAARVQQHALGLFPLTDSYKLIAADANKSNSVTAADASFIQQGVLGSPVVITFLSNNTWRFVPASYVFPVPTNPWSLGVPPYFPESIALSGGASNQDFIGMKLGDVNQSANPVNSPSANTPDLIWTVADQALEQDENYAVDFRVAHFDDILALQFALQFDPSKIQFQEIETIAGSILQTSNFGLYQVANGEIRAFLAMAESKSLPEGTPCFRLKFKALQSGIKMSEVLDLGSAIDAEVYNSDFVRGPVNLEYDNLSTGNNEPETANFRLLQNRPNPFRQLTSIGFILPEACDAQIRILDLNGRVVETRNGWFAKGYNELQFRLDGYTGDAVLYYELVTPFGIRSRKMVLLR